MLDDVRDCILAVLSGEADDMQQPLEAALNRINSADAFDILDALRAHPETGHVIFWSLDEIREHIADARGVDEDEIDDETARRAGRAMDWNVDIDYDSLADDE